MSVSLNHQRVTLAQPDQYGNLILTKEWYRLLEALVKAVNDQQAQITALAARVTALGG